MRNILYEEGGPNHENKRTQTSAYIKDHLLKPQVLTPHLYNNQSIDLDLDAFAGRLYFPNKQTLI